MARISGRNDVTAIPFGINTPTIFAYISLIMLPVYERTHDANLAWHMGIFASLVSGIVQSVSAFCIDWLRRTTPLAALLCPLAGLAMAFLCLGFIFGIFQIPAVALLPAVILLAMYASRMRLPWRIPSGLVAMVVGGIIVVILRAFHLYHLPPQPPLLPPGIYLPRPVNLYQILVAGRRLAVRFDFPAAELAGHHRFAADPGKREARRRRLSDNSIAAGQWPGHARGSGAGQRLPHFALHWPQCAQSQRRKNRIFHLGRSGQRHAVPDGTCACVLRFVPLEVVAFAVVWFGLAMVGQAFQEVPAAHASRSRWELFRCWRNG